MSHATISAYMLLLRYYLWIAPHLFLAAFLWIFLRRNLQKQLPFFTGYIVFQLIDFLASVIDGIHARGGPSYWLNIYRWVMVWDAGISTGLSFGVIYELVNQLIVSRSTLATTLRPVMRWTGAVLVLVIAATAGRLAVAGDERVMNAFQVLDFSASVFQVGLLLVLFLFSRVLRVSWRSLPVGIALGLGLVGCVELSAAGLLAVLGRHHYAAVDVMRLTAFHISVLIWLIYLLFPEEPPKIAGGPLQASELESWDQELQKMARR